MTAPVAKAGATLEPRLLKWPQAESPRYLDGSDGAQLSGAALFVYRSRTPGSLLHAHGLCTILANPSVPRRRKVVGRDGPTNQDLLQRCHTAQRSVSGSSDVGVVQVDSDVLKLCAGHAQDG